MAQARRFARLRSVGIGGVLRDLLVVGAVAAVGSALFTTFDCVSATTAGRDLNCGSPVSPRSRPSAAIVCEHQLGHARATRTAALAWATILGAGAWMTDSRLRRARARPPRARPHYRGETEHLVIRTAESSDTAAIAALVDDEVVSANGWAPGRAAELASARALPLLLRSYVRSRRRGGGHQQPLGSTGSCEAGWWLGAPARGQGLGTESLKGVLDLLHGVGYFAITMGTRTDNTRARHILEKVGAGPIGERPHRLLDGTIAPSIWYCTWRAPLSPKVEVVGFVTTK